MYLTPVFLLHYSHLSFRFRIVRNRASESVRGSSKDGGSVGDPGSPHGSPNGGDALQRGGTYSISGILGISPQGTSPITDHNGNTGTKRKLDETSKFYIYVYSFAFIKLSHVMRKPVLAKCELQRRRSACACAQSDQRLYCSLLR